MKKALIIVALAIIVSTVSVKWMDSQINKHLMENKTYNSTIEVTQGGYLQPAGVGYEDEYTAHDAIQSDYHGLQVTRHSWYLQPTEWQTEVTYDPQTAEDVEFNDTVVVYQGINL